MIGFDAWEKRLFDKYNGELDEVTEAELYDQLLWEDEDAE